MKKIFFTWFFLFPCFTNTFTDAQSVSDRIYQVRLNEVTVEGYLGDKINTCINKRVKVQDLNELINPFRHREETRFWQTEFWGKWITSAISAYEYNKDPELKVIIDNAVRELISTQTPDGYIGNYAPEAHLQQWDVWGRKYTLLGLIAYYDLSKDKRSLSAAGKLLDFTMTEIGPGKADINKSGNYRGMASGSILEPVVLMYGRTGDQKYLDFARYIAGQWEISDGPQLIPKALNNVPVAERFPVDNENQWWTWYNGQKAYEMMSCYEGLLELYRVTGEKKYLQSVRNVVKNIMEEEINICGSGAAMECWYHGRLSQAHQSKHSMETCVTMTWMKLLLNLYRLTAASEYLDQFEISMYNALLASLHPDGNTFSMYTPLCGFRQVGAPHPGMPYLDCCIANGPRGFMLIPAAMYMKSEDGLVVNLFSQGKYSTSLPGDIRLNIEQSTTYPKNGEITLKVFPQKSTEFNIDFRIPAWSKINKVTVNNKEITVPVESGYLKLKRLWNSGDEVCLSLDIPSKVIFSPEGSNHFAAVIRGPVVLVRDSENSNGIDSDELATPVMDRDNNIELSEVSNPGKSWMAFEGKFHTGSFPERNKAVSLILSDFASAGHGWKPDSRYRVWLPQLLDPSIR